MARTRLSTKGQVILPKAIRDAMNWAPGTVLDVTLDGSSVTLRQSETEKHRSLDDLIGIVNYTGPRKTLEDMQRGIDQAMAERWARKSKI